MNFKFIKVRQNLNNIFIRADLRVKRIVALFKKPLQNNAGWGKEEIIAIAITLMIAGLVMIPGLKTFASNVMSEVDSYFDSMKSKIFTTS